MTLAKQKSDWDHTARLHAVIRNANAAKGEQVTDPRTLNPYRVAESLKRQTTDADSDADALIGAFVGAQ